MQSQQDCADPSRRPSDRRCERLGSMPMALQPTAGHEINTGGDHQRKRDRPEERRATELAHQRHGQDEARQLGGRDRSQPRNPEPGGQAVGGPHSRERGARRRQHEETVRSRQPQCQVSIGDRQC